MPAGDSTNDRSDAQELARASYSIGPVPAWVRPFNPDLAYKSQGSEHISVLLTSQQVHAELRQSFYHSARRLETTLAVQEISQWTLMFEPRTQKIVLHFIRLWRDGAEINRLEPGQLRILQRMEGLERLVIDGWFTLLLVLEDVRVGDVLEYAYTVEGIPGPMPGSCSQFFSLAASISISHFHFSVRFTPTRPLKWKASSEDLQPVEESEGSLTVWKWERSAYQTAKPEPNVPHWHLTFPWIQVSDCADWQSVAAAFAAGFSEDNSEQLDELVRQLRGTTDDRLQQINRAIDFVQVECRYLSIDMGQGGHVPAPPSVVVRRRYGDCKDLALLLACLLKRLEVPAVPVLVHTWFGKAIAGLLPGAGPLNHAVVEFAFDGEKHWVDPTGRKQGGGALNRFIPCYGVGLPMSAEATGLIDQPQTAPGLHRYELKESIQLDTTGQFSYFGVHIRAFGEAADALRNQLANQGEEAFAKGRLQGFAKRFGQATRIGSLQYRDDREANEFQLAEAFEINGFLRPAHPGYCRFDHVTAGFGGHFLPAPGPERRTAPYLLTYPFNFSYTVDVEAPSLPLIKAVPRERIQSPHFKFSRVNRSSHGYWKTSLDLSILADSVSAEQVPEHRKRVIQAWGEAILDLTVPLGCNRGRLPASFGQLPPRPGNSAGAPMQKPVLRPPSPADPVRPVAPSPAPPPVANAARNEEATTAAGIPAAASPEDLVRRPAPEPEADGQPHRRRRRHRGRFFWVTPLACGFAAVVVLFAIYVMVSSPTAGGRRGSGESDAGRARRYRQAAVKGDADAQDRLGLVLMTGRGDGPDPVEAAQWFRKAAEQGLPDAEFNLGVAYFEGRGLAKDAAEAVKWYRRAAGHGVAKAQHNLSLLYMNGLGVERDESEGIRWCRQAAEQGLAAAQYDFGSSLVLGKGIAKDEVAGVKWLRKAADQGNTRAQYNLAIAYGKGEGVPKDPVEGYAWMKLASRQESRALSVLDRLEQDFPPAIISAGKQRAKDLQRQLDSQLQGSR